jgi:repressor LexA
MDVQLTEPQQLILGFIEERSERGESPPTYREICKRFGYRSPKAASDHIAALEKKGRVVRDKGRARGLRLVQKSPGIPLLGCIAAGLPREALAESDRQLALDPVACGIRDRSRAFALQVSGDSMTGCQIFDGDVVILESGVAPRNGDVVAAIIDNESTLKTFAQKEGKAWLRAGNPRYPDLIPVIDLTIQGVARAVIRFLK